MKGAVTASTQDAADAGVGMLRSGGNAIDAAVAAALATCVADPCNTGIGGYGGYLLVQRTGEDAKCVPFPLRAPANVPLQSLARDYPEEGPACSSVPNVIAGLARAHAAFGTLDWSAACAPAIALAREGVIANSTNVRAFAQQGHRAFVAECFEFEEEGEGLRFRQPRLATTLERLAEHGPRWFYEGPLRDGARAASRAAGIEVSEPEWQSACDDVGIDDAALFEVAGLRLQAAPLGLSGSACLFATVAAAAQIARHRPIASAKGLAELACAMASIWQYRFAMAEGNDFSGVDLERWIASALEGFDFTPRAAVPEPAHTAHLNAVDASGMVVALTFTHGPAWFGGRWAIPGTGVVMNGGMHNFTRAAPVKRGNRWYGVSNMTPTIATTAAGDRLALGGPGARRIPSNIALVLARHFIAGEGLQAAVSGGRLHAESRECAWLEGERLPAETAPELQARFGRIEPEDGENYFGPLTAAKVSAAGDIETATDDRIWRGFSARAA